MPGGARPSGYHGWCEIESRYRRRPRMASIDASARHDLTDARWALLEPLLPAPPVRGGPRRRPLRAMIDAVRWRTRVGAPWRDVPARVRALVEGVRPVPRLAAERGVGAHRGGPGRPGRRRREDRLAGVGGRAPPCAPAPHASGGPRGRRRARGGGAGRPRPGTVPGRMGHQDPAPPSRPASERGPCCSRPGRRGTAP